MENLDLYIRLNDLSKDRDWPSTDFCYTKIGDKWRRERRKAKNPKRGSIPDYDSDYLLSILRYHVSLQDDDTQWWARKYHGDLIIETHGETPLEALIKLTIELFKHNILVKPPGYDI